MSGTPTIGRIVHYRLSDQDVELIAEHRRETGEQGNTAVPGFVYPAIVVRTFDDTLGANLQVFLDGPDTLWVTSRGYSVETDGCWFWPPRLDMTMEGR